MTKMTRPAHTHISALRGEARTKAIRLGEPTSFTWNCTDASCAPVRQKKGRTSKHASPKGGISTGR